MNRRGTLTMAADLTTLQALVHLGMGSVVAVWAPARWIARFKADIPSLPELDRYIASLVEQARERAEACYRPAMRRG